MAGTCGIWGDAYEILIGKLEKKTQFGRPRLRCLDNIEVNLQEAGCEDGDRIEMAQVRIQGCAFVNTIFA
jgi:hypothetical protein